MTKLGYSGFQRIATTRFLRKVSLLALTVPFLTSIAIGLATANERENERENSNSSYAIGLWGDLPYNDVQAQTGVPNLIADMNSQDLAFTAF